MGFKTRSREIMTITYRKSINILDVSLLAPEKNNECNSLTQLFCCSQGLKWDLVGGGTLYSGAGGGG